MIENLLKLHMEWPMIEQVTGINQGRFQELKRLLGLVQLDQKQPSSLSPKPSATNQVPTN